MGGRGSARGGRRRGRLARPLNRIWAGRGSVMADSRGEPTMEEILASIRRIIADDPAPAGRLAPRKTGGRNSEAPDSEPAYGEAPSPEGADAAGTASFEAHIEAARTEEEREELQ